MTRRPSTSPAPAGCGSDRGCANAGRPTAPRGNGAIADAALAADPPDPPEPRTRMGRRTKHGKRARADQRRRFDQSIHPHTRPGTIIVPRDAHPPMLRVTCYGPEQFVDKQNVTPAQIRELRGKYPVMWIDASGFADVELI